MLRTSSSLRRVSRAFSQLYQVVNRKDNTMKCTVCNTEYTDSRNNDLIEIKERCLKCDQKESRVLDKPRAATHVAVDVGFDGAEKGIYLLRSMGFLSRKQA